MPLPVQETAPFGPEAAPVPLTAAPESLSPSALHFRVLLDCVRTGTLTPTPITDDGFDWDRLHATAERHGILPLLFKHLRKHFPNAAPPAVTDHLRMRSYGIARRNLTLAAEMGRVEELLRRAGVRALPYKGPILAAAYGDLSLRKFEDLDFLVPLADRDQALRVLQADGYALYPRLTPARERSYYHTDCECWLTNPDETVNIEIHWAVRERLYSFPLDLEAVYGRARPLRVAGATVPGICPEDLLLILAIHGIKHAWHQLKWTRDVASLLESHPEFDWDACLQRAREVRGVRLVLLAALLPHRLLETPLPPAVQRRAETAVGPLVDEIKRLMVDLDGEEPPERARYRLYLRAREDVRDRLRFLAGMCFTPTLADWEAFSLPDPLFRLYHLYRPARLLLKYTGLRKEAPGE